MVHVVRIVCAIATHAGTRKCVTCQHRTVGNAMRSKVASSLRSAAVIKKVAQYFESQRHSRSVMTAVVLYRFRFSKSPVATKRSAGRSNAWRSLPLNTVPKYTSRTNARTKALPAIRYCEFHTIGPADQFFSLWITVA